jgi:hypothetical protein
MPKLNSNFPNNMPDLLLDCIRTGSQFQALEALTSDDWQALLREAEQHSLGPLLYQRLICERPKPFQVPSEIEQKLRQTYYQTLRQNMLAYHLLGQILEHLQKCETRVLLLKGIYLADQIYGDIGLRPMGDLDLLVPRLEFRSSLTRLREMGFVFKRPYIVEADDIVYFHAPSLFKDEIELELHWDLVLPSSPVQIDIQGLWERARPITLENGQAWALAPEDLLLYLCIHAAYGHEFRTQLRSLVDIAKVIQHFGSSIVWDTLVDTALRWKASRGVYLCFLLVEELLGVELPPAALMALRPVDWLPQALDWAKWHLFYGESEQGSRFLRVMSSKVPLIQRFQALLRGMFPPRLVLAAQYGLPPDSWQLIIRYLPYTVGRFRYHTGHFLDWLRGDPRSKGDAHNTLALEDWLKIKS